jgi:transcriptional regulator with XRE-family HTH domain
MKTFCERLKEERLKLDMNQTQFGEAGGVLKGAQIKYESGARFPDSRYLEAIAAIGVDVQYVLTGVLSANALTVDEQLLLDRYRSSPQAIRDAALRVLLIGGAEPSRPGVVIHGSVGQQIDTQTAKNITINMPKK